MLFRKAIQYNLLAFIGAALGLVNTLLSWRLFGVTLDADAWLLCLTIIGVLNVFSLIGVEQFLYCYSDERTRSQDKSIDFALTSILWSLLSGSVFAVLCILAIPFLVSIFAGGFQEATKLRLAVILMTMMPQTVAAPCLHVVRQLLNAHGNYTQSYLLSIWAPFVLSLAQISGLLLGCGLEQLAIIVAFGAFGQIVLCLFLVRKWWKMGRLLLEPLKELRNLMGKSAMMRCAHALHNFLSTAIISSVLSTLSAGNLSLFLYAKRIADGVSSIATGPHINIYHAKLAQAWSIRARMTALNSAIAYLKHVLPLFVLGVALVWLMLPFGLQSISSYSANLSVISLISTFLVISIWNVIIAIEAVFVAVLITDHRSIMLALINGLFVCVFYALTNVDFGLAPLLSIPIDACIAQVISLILFAVTARILFKGHFSEGPTKPCS